MKDVEFYSTVSQICSVALRTPDVSGNFQNAANTMNTWQEALARLEAAKAAEAAPNVPAG